MPSDTEHPRDSGNESDTKRKFKRPRLEEMSGNEITNTFGFSAFQYKIKEKGEKSDLDMHNTSDKVLSEPLDNYKRKRKEKYSSEDYKNQYTKILEYQDSKPKKLSGEVLAPIIGKIRRKIHEITEEIYNCLNNILNKHKEAEFTAELDKIYRKMKKYDKEYLELKVYYNRFEDKEYNKKDIQKITKNISETFKVAVDFAKFVLNKQDEYGEVSSDSLEEFVEDVGGGIAEDEFRSLEIENLYDHGDLDGEQIHKLLKEWEKVGNSGKTLLQEALERAWAIYDKWVELYKSVPSDSPSNHSIEDYYDKGMHESGRFAGNLKTILETYNGIGVNHGTSETETYKNLFKYLKEGANEFLKNTHQPEGLTIRDEKGRIIPTEDLDIHLVWENLSKSAQDSPTKTDDKPYSDSTEIESNSDSELSIKSKEEKGANSNKAKQEYTEKAKKGTASNSSSDWEEILPYDSENNDTNRTQQKTHNSVESTNQKGKKGKDNSIYEIRGKVQPEITTKDIQDTINHLKILNRKGKHVAAIEYMGDLRKKLKEGNKIDIQDIYKKRASSEDDKIKSAIGYLFYKVEDRTGTRPFMENTPTGQVTSSSVSLGKEISNQPSIDTPVLSNPEIKVSNPSRIDDIKIRNKVFFLRSLKDILDTKKMDLLLSARRSDSSSRNVNTIQGYQHFVSKMSEIRTYITGGFQIIYEKNALDAYDEIEKRYREGSSIYKDKDGKYIKMKSDHIHPKDAYNKILLQKCDQYNFPFTKEENIQEQSQQ